LVWFKFLLCLVIILFAGTKLARYGDAIAEKTNLGRIWIGLILIAAVTSMPEFVTGISAAALVEKPDLALGTLLGSCIFNLAIIGLLDIMSYRVPILYGASSRHILAAVVGIVLAVIACGGILGGDVLSRFSLGWVGVVGFLLPVVYILGMRRMFLIEQKHKIALAPAVKMRYGELSSKEVYLKFALASVAVIGVGIWLSFVGDEIAVTTGWNDSFVGSLFLAITTSAPELVVAITALRIGAVDMAVADILGANMLDIAHVFTVDLFYTKGVILSAASNAHIITMGIIIIMSLLVILGLRFKQSRKTFVYISWYGVVLIGLYLFSAYALFVAVV